MADSPVESSSVQFCVSICLTVQSSPVESSIVLKQLAVQSSPVLCQYMADSPVQSGGVQYCVETVGSPVQFCVSIWLIVQWSPVQSSFVSVYG